MVAYRLTGCPVSLYLACVLRTLLGYGGLFTADGGYSSLLRGLISGFRPALTLGRLRRSIFIQSAGPAELRTALSSAHHTNKGSCLLEPF